MNTEMMQVMDSIFIPASNEQVVGEFVAWEEVSQDKTNVSPCSGSCNGSCHTR